MAEGEGGLVEPQVEGVGRGVAGPGCVDSVNNPDILEDGAPMQNEELLTFKSVYKHLAVILL